MNQEKLFSDMAKLYADKEGEQLKSENAYLVGNAPFSPSKDFEKRVYMRIRAERYRRPAYIMGSIAACILIALVSFNVLLGMNIIGDTRGAQNTQLAAREPGESRPADATAAGRPSAGAPAISGSAGVSAGHEMIKLAFSLPPNFSVTDVEQDIGQTIYYIQDTQRDDIVLIAEKSAEIGGTGRYSEDRLKEIGLTKIEINDTALYAVAKADYSYFTFQREGIIYNMTCKYDYKTLITFCEYIL